jgi:hypothetical protein
MKRTLVDMAGSIKLQLTESAEGGKHLIARGEFGRADVPTQNRRVYPRKIWEREIQRINEAMASGKVLGELDHPADGKTSLKRVSHIMTGLHMQDDGVIIGEAKILDNEYGRQLRSILEAGGAIGVSSRGMGSTNMGEDGSEVVQDDYQYMTHDFVADPAVLTSYPKFQTEVKWIKGPVMTETSEKEKTMDKVEQKVEAVVEAPKIEAPKEAVKSEAVVVPIQPLGTVASTPAEAGPVVEAPKTEKTESAPAAEAPKVEAAPAPEAPKVEAAPAAEAPKTEAAPAPEAPKTEEVKVEAKEQAALDLTAAQIALESIKSVLKPFMGNEDLNEAITAKNAEISAKDAEIGKLKTENTELRAKIDEIGAVANRIGAQLHFERKLGEMKEGRDEIRKLAKKEKFENVKAVDTFLTEAKKEIETIQEQKKLAELEQKRLDAKYESRLMAAEEKSKKLEEALKSTVAYSKELGLKLYVSEKTRGNPNALKIRELCEGKTDRKEVEAILERFSVAPKINEDYNAIKRRFEKFKNTSLVEEQLKEAGSSRSQGGSDEEGVLGEMKDLFPGATLDQVEALM